MPGAPDTTAVLAYLGTGASWSEGEVAEALAAEKAAQAHACVVPVEGAGPPGGDDWPADLAEALKRRVARNLSLRSNPTGLVATVTDDGFGATVRIGGDYEIRRLEAPYRRLVVG